MRVIHVAHQMWQQMLRHIIVYPCAQRRCQPRGSLAYTATDKTLEVSKIMKLCYQFVSHETAHGNRSVRSRLEYVQLDQCDKMVVIIGDGDGGGRQLIMFVSRTAVNMNT